jgi:hypothetical protein|uniref:Uncharacterized protein n=1 Tax=Siphoviridae sp. ct0d96 TaxID=2826268 RepID=A0A8S5M4U1_9CAUD|nr:hypothetical protein [uncultured Stomatobaculum sp.]DAD77119.1 MAG TPA: hypothetical protein [Siphoviridae sp. ct0d96]DAJ20216.1 MAG TPA: hypothetical protein [Siphoviridae sp. ctjRi1]DAK90345.1 MAG TPA: hypothetical protein [Caudoviricetes sp.]DAN44384.1 MAG TPA: hypothetical protein [Caudoviricetes sp.]DAN97486.1 MAG TPA: hypothetical protein [Caudoviricetes sp.]
MRIPKGLCERIAEMIIAGRMFFADIAKRLRPRVTEELKKRGREDLATDSNARPRDESEED